MLLQGCREAARQRHVALCRVALCMHTCLACCRLDPAATAHPAVCRACAGYAFHPRYAHGWQRREQQHWCRVQVLLSGLITLITDHGSHAAHLASSPWSCAMSMPACLHLLAMVSASSSTKTPMGCAPCARAAAAMLAAVSMLMLRLALGHMIMPAWRWRQLYGEMEADAWVQCCPDVCQRVCWLCCAHGEGRQHRVTIASIGCNPPIKFAPFFAANSASSTLVTPQTWITSRGDEMSASPTSLPQ